MHRGYPPGREILRQLASECRHAILPNPSFNRDSLGPRIGSGFGGRSPSGPRLGNAKWCPARGQTRSRIGGCLCGGSRHGWRPGPIERRCQVVRVYREKMRMLFGPFGGKPVERALGVVLLVGNHSADPDDQVVQAFRSGPEIADTDRGIVEVGMEDRRQHAALRRPPRIAKRKVYFQVVYRAFLNFAVRSYEQTLDVVDETVDLRRHTGRAGDLDERPALEALLQQVVVELQTADARREHGRRTTSLTIRESRLRTAVQIQKSRSTLSPVSSSRMAQMATR